MRSRSAFGAFSLFFALGWPAAHAAAQVFDVVHAKGQVEGTFYLPHGEFDMNPGVPFPERPTARYGLRTEFTLNPVKLPWLIGWADLRFYFGDTRPQTDYNYSVKGLAANLAWGVGIRVLKSTDLQVRFVAGELVDLGGLVYGDRLPWHGIQVRWAFDTHGRP